MATTPSNYWYIIDGPSLMDLMLVIFDNRCSNRLVSFKFNGLVDSMATPLPAWWERECVITGVDTIDCITVHPESKTIMPQGSFQVRGHIRDKNILPIEGWYSPQLRSGILTFKPAKKAK